MTSILTRTLVASSLLLSSIAAHAAVNIAPTGTASQSSTAYDVGFNGSGPASRAIDGNRDGIYSNGSVSHTGFEWPNPDPAASWQVSFSSPWKMEQVVVFNRIDNGAASRLPGFAIDLYLGASLQTSLPVATFTPTITGTSGLTGGAFEGVAYSFASVVADKVVIRKTDLNWLHLAEVEVMAAPVPEASEWAMMLAGLGVVGAVAKRRRRLADR